MMKSRIFNFTKNIGEIGEVRIAFKTFLFMLIPVFTFVIILEALIPKSSIVTEIDTSLILSKIDDIKIYILYLVAGSSHIIISFVVLIYMTNLLLKNSSRYKERLIKYSVIIFSVVLTSLFFIVDYFGFNLALLSHERIYSVLMKSPYFFSYFTLFPGSFLLNHQDCGFYLFSLMPFSLIFLGLLVIVFTCLNIGKDLNYFFKKVKFDTGIEERKNLLNRIKAFHNYLYILSFVLVTSTVATVLFLQLPLVCMSRGDLYQSFLETSVGIGICWGVIFSLTMLFMCFYPFVMINKKLKSIYIESEITGNVELKKWIVQLQNNYLIYKNVKTLISVLSPFIISLFAQFV